MYSLRSVLTFPTSCCCGCCFYSSLVLLLVVVACMRAGSACALWPSRWGLRATLWCARRMSLRVLAQLMMNAGDREEIRYLLSSDDSPPACFCLFLPMGAGSGCRCGKPTSVCVLHVKSFFIPITIHCTQRPCRFFTLERLCVYSSHETGIFTHRHPTVRADYLS